jgi:hypothetical protein
MKLANFLPLATALRCHPGLLSDVCLLIEA